MKSQNSETESWSKKAKLLDKKSESWYLKWNYEIKVIIMK